MCSLYSDADHLEILIQAAESKYLWQPIYMNAQKDFLHILCWKTVTTGKCRDFPPRSLFGWKVRASAFHFVLQAKPVPLKHMEISSKGAECLMWGCPCCLPEGSSFLARKRFCSLFSINQVCHIKKDRKQGKLSLFLIIELCFLDNLVLLESWLNADFIHSFHSSALMEPFLLAPATM